jgi:large subunit ribosomal protein L2
MRYAFALNKFLALTKYSSGTFALIKSVESNFIGDFVCSVGVDNVFQKLLPGFRTFLELIGPRQLFCEVALPSMRSTVYAKARGCFAYSIYLNTDLNLLATKLPTGKIFFLNLGGKATVGRVAGKWAKLEMFGQAGHNSIIGRKSIVRGVAMNPVDHPHGGRTKTNSPEVSPWG